MAEIEKIVPFILHFEAGVPQRYLEKRPEEIYGLARKSGLANDADDRGGLTMCGVTYSTYARWCNRKGKDASERGLKNLRYEEWLDILKTMYWNRWKADSITDQSVANILVDWVWASGITGIKRAQKILGVMADGIVGKMTLGAVNGSDGRELFARLKADRLKHFEEICRRLPSQKKFLRGWQRRVNAIEYGGFRYE